MIAATTSIIAVILRPKNASIRSLIAWCFTAGKGMRRQPHSGNEIARNCQARPLVRPSTLLKHDRKFEYGLDVLYTPSVLESKIQELDRHALTG